MNMKWQADAPSNIALIKYMGKSDPTRNIPTNASLSLTLPHFRSFVELELSENRSDQWEPLVYQDLPPLDLSEFQQNRFIQHLGLIKSHLDFAGHFIVRSCNNFPIASGLASSASSFAALTQCATLAIADITEQEPMSLQQKASLSQRGSGSSCRSFLYPWTLWRPDGIEEIFIPFTELSHCAVIIDGSEKEVSSSQAQKLVMTSPHFSGRPARAEQRLQTLVDSLNENDWHQAYSIVKDEFIDMHELFHTADTPFKYMNEGSENIINLVDSYWQDHQDGPLITMDAGPNVHLIFRQDQEIEKQQLIQQIENKGYHVIH